MKAFWIVLGAAWLCCASIVFADQIIFKNGDHLTGTIKSAAGGKLTIDTPMAGTVTADLANIKTFSTDHPISIQLPSGQTIEQPASAASEGMIAVPGTSGVSIVGIKAINPPKAAWTGSIKAGAIVTRGNSDTENFNLALDATRRTDKDRITASAGYFFGRQRDPNTGARSTTADNWFALGKYDYFFSPKLYGYAQTRVEQDRVAELALRVSPGIGAGYQWYETADFSLSTEAGLNWVYERYDSDGDDEHVAGRLAYHIEKKLNDKVTLFNDFEYLPSLQWIADFNINADAGLRTTIYKNIFSELKAEWQYDSTPAPGAQSNDFRYTLSMGWNF